jgi:hypothetical protein
MIPRQQKRQAARSPRLFPSSSRALVKFQRAFSARELKFRPKLVSIGNWLYNHQYQGHQVFTQREY